MFIRSISSTILRESLFKSISIGSMNGTFTRTMKLKAFSFYIDILFSKVLLASTFGICRSLLSMSSIFTPSNHPLTIIFHPKCIYAFYFLFFLIYFLKNSDIIMSNKYYLDFFYQFPFLFLFFVPKYIHFLLRAKKRDRIPL